MSVEKAKAHFLGTEGCKRLNCAEAIAHVYKEKFAVPAGIITACKGYGGGHAPKGVCGSVYAACVILGLDSQAAKECAAYFISCAGALTCRDIRKLKKLSCVGCIEKIAEFLEKSESMRGTI